MNNFEELIKNEGGYSNDPNDPGGETNYGITIATARKYGYMGEMKDLSLPMAEQIYKGEYWLSAFDQLDPKIAFEIFDAAVNSGVRQAVKWLQRAVGVIDDGYMGTVTIEAAKTFEPRQLCLLFLASRLEFMTGLSIWENFGKGWARRIANNMRRAAS
jgi:lysozyme family protein